MSNAEKARAFLDYVATHDAELRRAARGVGFDEDVYSDTVVRVHDSILRHGTDVSDPARYFLRAYRFERIWASRRAARWVDFSFLRGAPAGDAGESAYPELERFIDAEFCPSVSALWWLYQYSGRPQKEFFRLFGVPEKAGQGILRDVRAEIVRRFRPPAKGGRPAR